MIGYVYIEGNNYKESIMNEPITKGSIEDEHLHSINPLKSRKSSSVKMKQYVILQLNINGKPYFSHQ